MGFWAYSVIGGDFAEHGEEIIMDEVIDTELPENMDEDSLYLFIQPRLQDKQLKLLKILKKDKFSGIFGIHALGWILLRCGCKIEEEVKTEILKAVDSDNWDHIEREYHMENLRKAVEKNEGKVVKLPYETVYDIMMEPRKEGEGNLINKIPVPKKKK